MALPMSRPTRSKSGVYYLQKRVPSDLVQKVGRRAIKRSLRTKDPLEAKARHAQALQELELEWAVLRSDVLTLSHRQVVALSRQRCEEYRANFGDNPPSVVSTENEMEMRKGVGDAPERLEIWYGRTADSILKTNGIKVDGTTRLVLLKELHRTDEQSLENVKRNACGDYSPDPQADRFPELSLTTSSETVFQETSIVNLFELWKRDHVANGGAAKTIDDFQQKVLSLGSYVGQQDAGRITGRDISKWCDHLLHDKNLSSRTVRDKYLAAAKAIFRTGTNKHILISDPTSSVVIKVVKPQRFRSKGYTDDEAAAILSQAKAWLSVESRMSNSNKLAIRWIPWICAFTGARAGEASQLRKEDFFEQEGVWCVKITPEAGSVKTGAFRLVPLHLQLIEEGLIDFVEASPVGHLFFTLKSSDTAQKQAQVTYKAVAKWIKKSAGVSAPTLQPNHAWRHRFKTLCRDSNVGTEYSDAMTGHDDRRAATGYGEVSVRALKREMDKLPFYSLD